MEQRQNFLKSMLVILFILCFTSISLAQGWWETKAPIPTARGYLSTCVVDGKIYAIGGGFNASTGSKNVEVYDPVTDSWTIKNNLSEPMCASSTTQVNGKIYIIGGASSPLGTVYSSVYEYDPVTEVLIRKQDMPTGRLTLSTSVLNGKIFAIGGAKSTSNYQAEKTVEEYDPATDTWKSKADMLTAKAFLSTAVVNGKIYAIGGASTKLGPVLITVEEYNPTTDTWTQKADLNTARGWLAASEVNGNIYAFAGASDADSNPNISSIELYNPMSDEWTIIDSIPTARRTLCSNVVEGVVYTIAGITGGWGNLSVASDKVEAYTPQVVSVEENPISEIIPCEYLLSQNYPNPFNPTTTIKYSIPELSFVTIKIYDVLGSEVATLVNEEKSEGSYELNWNAVNLPSGVYFYRIQAGNFIDTKKMILLR